MSAKLLLPLLALHLLGACQHHDKALHFAAGAAVSHVVATQTGSKPAGCAAALAAGLLKEAMDHQADPADLAATGLGCSVSWAF